MSAHGDPFFNPQRDRLHRIYNRIFRHMKTIINDVSKCEKPPTKGQLSEFSNRYLNLQFMRSRIIRSHNDILKSLENNETAYNAFLEIKTMDEDELFSDTLLIDDFLSEHAEHTYPSIETDHCVDDNQSKCSPSSNYYPSLSMNLSPIETDDNQLKHSPSSNYEKFYPSLPPEKFENNFTADNSQSSSTETGFGTITYLNLTPVDELHSAYIDTTDQLPESVPNPDDLYTSQLSENNISLDSSELDECRKDQDHVTTHVPNLAKEINTIHHTQLRITAQLIRTLLMLVHADLPLKNLLKLRP